MIVEFLKDLYVSRVLIQFVLALAEVSETFALYAAYIMLIYNKCILGLNLLTNSSSSRMKEANEMEYHIFILDFFKYEQFT